MNSTSHLSAPSFHRSQPRVIMLGVFDGLHLGHRALLQQVFHIAHAEALRPAVATFWPHPAAIVAPGRLPRLLQPWSARREALTKAGIDANDVLEVAFTQALSQLTPLAFAQHILVEKMHAQHVVIGHDFRFGHRRAGTVQTLISLGQTLGFKVTTVQAVVHARLGTISSTAIRTLMATGRLAEAADLWGQTPRIYPIQVHRGAGLVRARRQLELIWPRPGPYSTTFHNERFDVDVDTEGLVVHALQRSAKLCDEILLSGLPLENR